MTPAEIAADVDATIIHWRTRGVGVEVISAALRCHHSWRAIRAAMIAIMCATPAEPAQRAA